MPAQRLEYGLQYRIVPDLVGVHDEVGLELGEEMRQGPDFRAVEESGQGIGFDSLDQFSQGVLGCGGSEVGA